MRALEFHHLDPMEKDFGISRTLTKSMATLIAETDKCILLCSNCHAEEHQKLFDLGYSQFNPDIWPHNRRVTGSSPVCPARVATTQRKCCGWFWSAFHQYINKSALVRGYTRIGIGAWFRPKCISIRSSTLLTRTIVDFTILSMLEWKGFIQIAQIGLAKRRDRWK